MVSTGDVVPRMPRRRVGVGGDIVGFGGLDGGRGGIGFGKVVEMVV